MLLTSMPHRWAQRGAVFRFITNHPSADLGISARRMDTMSAPPSSTTAVIASLQRNHEPSSSAMPSSFDHITSHRLMSPQRTKLYMHSTPLTRPSAACRPHPPPSNYKPSKPFAQSSRPTGTTPLRHHLQVRAPPTASATSRGALADANTISRGAPTARP